MLAASGRGKCGASCATGDRAGPGASLYNTCAANMTTGGKYGEECMR
jgi:hypothetical protein